MQKFAKVSIFTLLAVVIFTSCGANRSSMNTQNAQIERVKREDYMLLNSNVQAEVKKNVFWLLFLPFGRQSEQTMKERAYTKAVNSVPNASGILNPRFEFHKRTIPLIVFTFTHKTLTIKGEAFRMKTEAELELQQNKAAKKAVIKE